MSMFVFVLSACSACSEDSRADNNRNIGNIDSQSNSQNTNQQTTNVSIQLAEGQVTFHAEVADDEKERAVGLMYRESIANNEGMLFVYPQAQELVFWMKNTLVPLDMIFIQNDRKILGIVKNAEPETTTQRRVAGMSQFVLEIKGGRSDELGIEAGQKVNFDVTIPKE